jgi:hypothetical protein
MIWRPSGRGSLGQWWTSLSGISPSNAVFHVVSRSGTFMKCGRCMIWCCVESVMASSYLPSLPQSSCEPLFF